MRTGTLADVWADMENGTYDFTKNGKCIGCGNCCSSLLWLSKREIREIKAYIRKHNIKEQIHAPNALLRTPTIDLTCPFLNDNGGDKKCVCYEVRPFICRAFSCAPDKRLKLDEINLDEQREPVNMREVFFGKRG